MTNRIVIIADASQVKTFLECHKRWYYEYVLKIQQKGLEKQALDTGTVLHALVEVYYKHLKREGPILSRQLALATLKRNMPRVSLTPDEIQFCKDRFLAYLLWTQANHCEFIPVEVNGKPQVEIGFSKILIETPQFLFIVEGKIDLIAQMGKERFVVDHKSQSRKYDHYEFDPQFRTYTWASNVRQGIVNYLGTQQKITEDTFRRLTFAHSTMQVQEWEERLKVIFYQMAGCIVANHFEKNEMSCVKFYRCQYTNLCESINPQTRDQLIKFNYEEKPKWEPWTLKD